MKFNYTKEPGKTLLNRYTGNEGKVFISIITAYYNASKYIMQTAYSVLNQTFPYFEWIIINDGSNLEGEDEKLQEVASLDKRIRIINQENAGATSARMRGISEAQSELITILDADDLIDVKFLEYTYFALQQHPDAMWAYTDSVGFGEQEYVWSPEFSSEKMKEMNILVYCTLIRKEVFMQEKLYDVSTKNEWEDYQLWLKMLAKQYVPVHVKQILFWYRRLQTGELAKIEKNSEQKEKLRSRIESLCKYVPDGIRAIEPYRLHTEEFCKPYSWNWTQVLPYNSKKTRVLFLFPHMECGGADKFNLDIVNHIDKTRFECSIITTINNDSEWRQEFTDVVQDVFELPSFLNMKDWSAFIHYFMVSRGIDIVCNISSYYSYYLFPWLRVQFPEVALIDCVHADAPYWREGGYTRTSANMGNATELTYVTNAYTRDLLVSKYGKELSKTKVIHTGVDEKVYSVENVDEGNIREQYSIDANKFTVMFLCRMAPEKRPFLFLKIAEKIKAVNPDIQFLMVGGGPQLEDIRSYVSFHNLDNVIITGRQEDIKPFYKVSDIYLLCSIMEGLSVTTIEAMLMGIPVISADVGSQFELVDDTTGHLVTCRQDGAVDFDSRNYASEEIEEYMGAILDLYNNKTKYYAMKKRCREKALNGFTLSDLMQTLEEDFSYLISLEAKEKRNKAVCQLRENQSLVEDYLTTYVAYEKMAAITDDVWRSCQYEMQQKQQFQNRLNEIYNMKAWKLILKYQNSILFKLIKKLKKG